MPNYERTGYRDLIFSQWHRLIPYLKMIDLDVLQVCKCCSKPTLLAEITRQTPRKPTKILQTIGQELGVQSVLINFYTRTHHDAWDRQHAQFLQEIARQEAEIMRLTRQKTETVNLMYVYCANTFGTDRAYGATIKFCGIEKVAPERSKYETFDDMARIKVAFEKYRYCSPECGEADRVIRPAVMPVIDLPPAHMAAPIKRMSQRLQPYLSEVLKCNGGTR